MRPLCIITVYRNAILLVLHVSTKHFDKIRGCENDINSTVLYYVVLPRRHTSFPFPLTSVPSDARCLAILNVMGQDLIHLSPSLVLFPGENIGVDFLLLVLTFLLCLLFVSASCFHYFFFFSSANIYPFTVMQPKCVILVINALLVVEWIPSVAFSLHPLLHNLFLDGEGFSCSCDVYEKYCSWHKFSRVCNQQSSAMIQFFQDTPLNI